MSSFNGNHPNYPSSMQGSARISSKVVMRQLAAELSGLAEALEQFQHDLSDMLVEAHVSPMLMRRAQAIDGATQSLHALSGVARTLATACAGSATTVDAQELESLVPLGELLFRLTGSGSEAPKDKESGHVSLF
ncbi:hypothetical protein [Tropicimonas aquimaris]|uniref:HPt domain-containing protein n=1 Tax=Tropicimonas aquimaris TaxID=914152 RepID=A0ABW3IKA4_9RHOB